MGETHVFFIRHGESIDDVSRGQYVPCYLLKPMLLVVILKVVYSAGPPDSPLTSHGVIQSNLLGAHLAGRMASLGLVPHLFCSDFQQARMTAEAIRDAYVPNQTAGPSSASTPVIEIIQLGELREKQFRERTQEASKSAAAAQHGGEAYTEGEPSEEVNARAKRFLDAVLIPLLEDLLLSDAPQCVFIVAHGGIHSHLWLQFVRVLRALQVPTLSTAGIMRLELVPLDEFLSNAAYHEVVLNAKRVASKTRTSPQPTVSCYAGEALSAAQVTFVAVNCVDHLSGLKKTGGGIGNSKFDKKQRKIDSFFVSQNRRT